MIHLYDIGNSGYDKFGDVILKPLSGKVRQAAGGGYDLTMEVPIDAEGAWAHIVPGAIVKVPVPKETIKNAFAGLEADVYKTNDEAILREGPSEPTQITYSAWSYLSDYAVGDKVTHSNQNYKCTYYDETSPYAHISPPNCNWWAKIPNRTEGSAALCTLKAGTELYFVEAYDETWYKMSTFYGIVGYVKISQLTYDRHVTPSEITDHVITEQLFRLREPTVNTEKNTVSVAGQHVSYDLAGILVKDINISQAAPAMAISHIVGAFMMDYAGEIATDMVDDDNGTFTGEIKGKNGIYALLDPDNGIVGQFDAKLTRDNWDIFVMKKPEADPVCSIAYGKNVRGITWKRSSNDLITRIVPVAKNEAGEDLYLPEQWVDSELISDYPVIIMERLNVQGQVGQAKSEEDETTWTESDLLDEMRTKAGERFSVDKVDQIKVEVTVQLEQLGASPEYEWLKKLESLLLYDKVVVQDRRIGLSVTVDAVEIEYDIVQKKVTGLKLSNVDYVNGSSIAGYNVKNHSITADKLVPGLADQIVSRAVGTVPEFAQPFDQTTHMNSASQDGLVKKGSGNGNKVWGTDANGNPDWINPPAVSVTDGDPTLAWGTRSKVGTVGSTDLHVTMPTNPASASDNNPTLAWGSKSKVGTTNGVDLHVTMPSNPNTWRPVVDNLTSADTDKSLSANQGKVLKGLIDTVTIGTPTNITELVAGQTVDVTTLGDRAAIRTKAGVVYVYVSITTARAIAANEAIMGGVPSQGTKYPIAFSGGYRGFIDGTQVKTSVAIPAGTVVVGFVAFPE